MKIQGKRPLAPVETTKETSRNGWHRPIQVKTAAAAETGQQQTQPDLQTQLEYGEKFRQKMSQVKVNAEKPAAQPRIAPPILRQINTEEPPKKEQPVSPLKEALYRHAMQRREQEAEHALASTNHTQNLDQNQLISKGNPTITKVQPKLTIGAPGDKYEQEADRVAAQVVQQINAPVAQQSQEKIQREEAVEEEEVQKKSEVGTIQREGMQEEDEKLQMKPMVQLQSSNGGMAATDELETSIQQARGGGQPLAEHVRKPMEQEFGADFSGVRVHTDAQADQLNKSVQAKAFTTGQDVFFRQGEYQPGSRGGQELLAHELTHVVQQSGGEVREVTEAPQGSIQRGIEMSKLDPRKIKEVESQEFNKYIEVTNIRGEIDPTTDPNTIGHSIVLYFKLRNKTKDKVKFRNPPLLLWIETINIKEGEEGPLETEGPKNQYLRERESVTSRNWKEAWKDVIFMPGEEKELQPVTDWPRINTKDGNGVGRTHYRSIYFEIGVEGSDKRLLASQILQVIGGVEEQKRMTIEN